MYFYSELFFCCWKALLKLGASQFSSMFFIPNSGSSFPANENGFSTECFETDFFSNVIHSHEGEQIFGLMFFYSVQISCWWKPFSKHFLYIYSCRWKQFFGVVQTYFFLTNPEFLCSRNSILLFTASLSSCGNYC